MAKYWLGSLEQIMGQQFENGKRKPSEYRACKGWKVELKADEAQAFAQIDPMSSMYRDALKTYRDPFAEACWANTQEIASQHNYETVDELRSCGDFQLRVTGPVDLEEPMDKLKRTLDKAKGKTL